MRPLLAPMLLVCSCGSAPAPAPASAPEPAPEHAPTPAPGPAPASNAPPTGGAVMVGDINAPNGFHPKPIIEALSAELVRCYNEARVITPDLRGKVTLRIQVNEAGAVLSVDAEPGGHANDPGLVSCVNDLMKASAHFPKPGGMATVTAPLVFSP